MHSLSQNDSKTHGLKIEFCRRVVLRPPQWRPSSCFTSLTRVVLRPPRRRPSPCLTSLSLLVLFPGREGGWREACVTDGSPLGGVLWPRPQCHAAEELTAASLAWLDEHPRGDPRISVGVAEARRTHTTPCPELSAWFSRLRGARGLPAPCQTSRRKGKMQFKILRFLL